MMIVLSRKSYAEASSYVVSASAILLSALNTWVVYRGVLGEPTRRRAWANELAVEVRGSDGRAHMDEGKECVRIRCDAARSALRLGDLMVV